MDELIRVPPPHLIPHGIGYPKSNDNGETHGGWQRLDLADPQYARPPQPPALLNLIYKHKRHVISGTPESAKTLISYILILQAIRDGWNTAILDFEMGATASRTLLVELGATDQELTSIYYVNPETPPDNQLQHIINANTTLILLDAAVGAYDISGLDDNARKDAETFARTWINPLWEYGISSLLLDHVTKNTDTRGKYAIGSERKIGGSDIHLGLEALKPLTRGGDGLVKIHVHKDRPGFLPRPNAGVVELHSDPLTHHITWHMREEQPVDQDVGFRPTKLMEKISRYLEQQDDPVSRNTIQSNVTGKTEYIVQALTVLHKEGWTDETEGARGALLVTLNRPYSESVDPKNTTSSHPFPTSSRKWEDVPLPVSPPLQGETEEDDPATRKNPPLPLPHEDPETQYLLDTYTKPKPPANDDDDGIPF